MKPFIILALKRDAMTGRILKRTTKAIVKSDRAEVVHLAKLLFASYDEVSVI